MNELKMNGPEESPTFRRKVSFHLTFEFTSTTRALHSIINRTEHGKAIDMHVLKDKNILKTPYRASRWL